MSQSGRKTPKLVAENRYAGTKPAAKTSAPKSRAKRKPVRKRPTGPLGWIGRGIRWVVRLLFRLFWSIGVVACLIVAGAVVYTATTLPPVDELIDGRARGSVTLLDATGAPFAWRGDQFGGMITADMVSPHLRNAVVATEDKRFYWHIGVSPRGIASAVRINLQAGRGALSGNGGSTITQQTAKLLCQGQPFDATIWDSEAAYEEDCRRTTIWRKATEAVYAMAMELRYTKDEILTLYLNRAYLGAGTRGFEAAAQRYFGISAAEVNPSQAAILAGLLKAPSTYAPTANLQRSWDRANVVLTLMEDQGYLTAAQTAEARTNPAQLSEAAEARAGGYFADWVMDTGPSYFTETTTEDVIIRTTLDQDIQSAAEEALAWVFENKVREGSEAQAAIVVMSADGAVRAMVGGRETKVAGVFNRATQALRQTGSLFKPFIYAAALELGHSPLELIVDEPLCLNVPGSGEWCPQNYDREFKGPITLTDALANSRNVPAVLLSEDVGREAVQTVARGFGMTGELADGPAIALGVTESTLVEMAGAYAGILNGGSSVVPYGLVELRLLGDDTSLMGSGGGIGERIIREESAQQLVWMMHQVVEVGSGMRARIDGWEIAGKSGTTQGARDAWFIGFTGDYVTAVWMGYDNNTPLTGVTGGGLPATIWHETMVRVLADKSPTPLPMIVPAPVEQPVTVNTGQQQGGGIIDNLLRDLLGGGQ
jgi:membrane peptidoglycan carboxypeptidase